MGDQTRWHPLSVLLLATLLAGCSIPSWVPLIGKQRPAARAALPTGAPAPQAPRLSSGGERLSESDAVLDRVVCVVNNDAITLFELEEAEAYYLYETKEPPPPDGEARRELRERLLRRMIENRLQLQQAAREKITVEDVELAEQFAGVRKRLDVTTEADLEKALRAQGVTVEGVKKRLTEQLMVQKLIRRKVALRISVTEQEIDRYLAANREKLDTGLSFEARHILVLPDPAGGEAGWAETRRKAEAVHAQLVAGEDFAQLAEKFSDDGTGKDGGQLGVLKRGELDPEIEKAILALRPGEISDPFRSHVGYHVFRLDKKETLEGEGLRQARDQIRDILYREKYQARFTDWLADLKQRALIDVRL